MNIFFADNCEKIKNGFLDSCSGFRIFSDDNDASVDVLVVDATAKLEGFRNRRVDTCFCPSFRFYDVVNSIRVNSAISCGMRERDSVTFSSISEDDAFVCFKRKILFFDKEFDPCEFRVSFDRKKGLYSNLVIGALEYVVNNYGG